MGEDLVKLISVRWKKIKSNYFLQTANICENVAKLCTVLVRSFIQMQM